MKGMSKGERGYIMKRGNEYLMAIVEPFGGGYKRPQFTIYLFDAAIVPMKKQAEQIIDILRKDGEQWETHYFNHATGEVRA